MHSGRHRTLGLRHNSDALITVDMQAAMRDGIKFFVSPNKVILTRGLNGVLPPKYMLEIVQLNSKRTVIWRQGRNRSSASSDHVFYVS